jgi:HPr kinase/phosphorylase
MAELGASVHGCAVLAGARAVLIRGPSGAGKSRLALELIEAGRSGALLFARLVGDDRLHLQAAGGRLLVRPAASLAGLLEVRGIGIVKLPFEPIAVVGLAIDLSADAERLPARESRRTEIEGVSLPRLAVAAGDAALPAVLALLTSLPLAFGRTECSF